MKQPYSHDVLFCHRHSSSKDTHNNIEEVTKPLSSMCKHLSLQLSENKGDITKYCKPIKNENYSSDIDVLFVLGGDGTLNELVSGVIRYQLNLLIGVIPGGTFNDFVKTL